jgi:hypothetical protein
MPPHPARRIAIVVNAVARATAHRHAPDRARIAIDPSFTGKNRQRFFRYRASFPAAKSAVFAACLVA